LEAEYIKTRNEVEDCYRKIEFLERKLHENTSVVSEDIVNTFSLED
jgi:hypothetical protein